MISCIICSRQPDISNRLKENVAQTIGVEHELIIIDNSLNQYSIFSAYNEGVSRANGDILCFMHEDILFHTNEWGGCVENIFEDDSIGIVGVLGTQFMPKTLCAWWWSGCTVGHVLQSRKKRLGENDTYVNGYPIPDDVDAAIVDGLWYCMRKRLFDEISYDTLTYNGFHAYDHDICMQALSIGKRVIVSSCIVIEHASEGDVGDAFLHQMLLFFNKWEQHFPIARGIQLGDVAEQRIENVVRMLERQVRNNIEVLQSRSYQCAKKLSNIIQKLKGR